MDGLVCLHAGGVVRPAESGAAIRTSRPLGVLRRFISGTLAVVLATGVLLACGPTRPSPAELAVAQQAWAAQRAAAREALAQHEINFQGQLMQIDPFMDPAVRANPLPCARATYEAEQTRRSYLPGLGEGLAGQMAAFGPR